VTEIGEQRRELCFLAIHCSCAFFPFYELALQLRFSPIWPKRRAHSLGHVSLFVWFNADNFEVKPWSSVACWCPEHHVIDNEHLNFSIPLFW
jgi:hypothetical protein